MYPIKSDDSLLDAIDNVMHILVTDIGTCWQTEPHLEDRLRHAVQVGRSTLIYRLLVHRFPYGTTLHLLPEHKHTQCLDIVIGLTIGSGTVHTLDDTSRATNRWSQSEYESRRGGNAR